MPPTPAFADFAKIAKLLRRNLPTPPHCTFERADYYDLELLFWRTLGTVRPQHLVTHVTDVGADTSEWVLDLDSPRIL